MISPALRRRVVCTLLTASALAAQVATGRADVAPRPSAGCTATTIQKGRPLQRTISVNGVERSYLLDVPNTVLAQRPAPLLLDFHGFQHSGAGVWRVSGFKDLAARDGFITVYPDGLPVQLLGTSGAGWEMFEVPNNRDLAFTRALLDQLEQTYCVDRARIYATGFSNGGFFSDILACTMADRFAAVAPVGGGRVAVPCDPGRGVPIIIFHGRKDEVVPIALARQDRDTWTERNRCREHASNGCEWHRECRDGAEVRYCETDDAHQWPQAATVEIWEFFKQHPLQ
jgi:polyhydroxybutyrate depolymerase